LKEELAQYRKNNPKITEQFADLKRKLDKVSYEEWDAIPDIGDYTIKNKKKFASFMPAPDTLLQKALAEKEVSTTAMGGLDTPSGSAGANTDLTAVGEGRGTVLGLKLDHLSDSVSGQTVVDPKGYLTDLKSMKISSSAEISDIKKARLLLKSVISTNPKHAPGWIAAARLEELAGKLQAARSFIQKGCDACPKAEDVWIEAARLNTPENARAILARGVISLPSSVKIWMQAAQLEDEEDRKRRVLRKALENIPNSVRLWKAVVDLSSEEDARVLLSRAVECCPQHVDLWLALARLESYDQARKVLNKARLTLPTEPAIWVTAAKLEEANDNAGMVGKIVERAIKSLTSHGVSVDREYWLKEAETAEKNEPPATTVCREIVRVTVGVGVEDEDRKRTWQGAAR
jgi:pre-mRNA-processing factor 6